MKRAERVLSFSLVLVFAACATGRPATEPTPAPSPWSRLPARPAPGRLPVVGTPTGYDLDLRIDPREKSFSGETRMHLDLLAATDVVPFDAVDMELTKVEALVGDRVIEGRTEAATGDPTSPVFGEHVAVFPEALPKGKVTVRFVYTSPFDPHLSGLYRAEQDGRWYAFSQFEAADARKAFPCMDEPGWKTPFRIRVSVPEGMKAVSNTPVESSETKDGWTTVRFLETRPLPTYLVAFVVGDVDVIDQPFEVPLHAITPKGHGEDARDALALHADFVPILADYFGHPYPYRKLDAAAAVQFAAGAMENAGLITYREEYLLVPRSKSSVDSWERTANTVAHELAHQWVGDYVTMEWWNDIWLNEAFATWMAAKAVDLWHPEYEERLGLLSARSWVFHEDALASARAVRQPVESVADAERAFDGITYVKGANVLAMLEHWVGEDTFRDGIRRYLEAHAWGNATSADLMAALSSTSGRDVGAVAGTFVDRPGVPQVSVEVRCTPDAPAVAVLTQSRYRPLGGHAPAALPDGTPWRIPVCLAWPEGGKVEERCELLESEKATVQLGETAACPAWVHPNAGEYGYYHWAVEPSRVGPLVEGLETPWKLAPQGRLLGVLAHPQPGLFAPSPEGGDRLLQRNRAALLDQLASMVAAGTLAPSAYLPLLAEIGKDPDPRMKLRVVSAVGQVALVWPDLAQTPAFAAWVRDLFDAEGHRLGFEPKADETPDVRQLRPAILGLLGRWGDAGWVLDEASALSTRWLDGDGSVPQDVATSAVLLAARAGRLDVDRLVAVATKTDDPRRRTTALQALGSLPAGPALTRALDLTLTKAVQLQDQRYVFMSALADPSTREQVFTWTYANWDGLSARLPKYGWGGLSRFGSMLGSLCSREAVDEARSFLESHLGKGAERSIDEGVEAADQCIALRGAGHDALAAFLAARPAKEAAR